MIWSKTISSLIFADFIKNLLLKTLQVAIRNQEILQIAQNFSSLHFVDRLRKIKQI